MITLSNVHKSFNGNIVLNGVNLTISEGEMLALIGRSGIGKSVLLKHIVGLIKPDAGDILIDGININRLRGKELEAIRKRFGFLFQEGALFDSLTVYDNVAFPLREKTSLSEEMIREKVFCELENMGLEKDAHKYPAELSGGMRKRAALARAMVMQPSIMLFDEPTTGLDPIIGQSILNYIQACHKRGGFTGIIVTHDVPRVFSIVQRIAMLHDGNIILIGTYEHIIQEKNPIFEQFLSGNLNGPLTYS
ncbi:MAG: ABC transporter ATP-binding protein [Desulfobacterota bacterium]|nr:ABC transporter ATP-binding protein [Thermodesulfobacteriota bacterium]